jgi:hypothetical protein
MALSDTQIHHVELLLTLDYLLNNTDEKHPATQQAICMHAKHFGYHYDPNAKSGNDVRRQRIGGCLSFLYEFSQKNPGRLPFVIKKTESNKYYIESKCGLNDDQVAEIIAAIQNEKFISKEETERLVWQTLVAFSPRESRGAINAKAEVLYENVRKYSTASSRNLRLVMNALTSNLLIKIDRSPNGEESRREGGSLTMMKDFDWYRVGQIKEYKNKYYALLFPVCGGGYLLEPIDELIIPYGDDCLMEDPNPKRDLNDLYFKKSKNDLGRVGTSLNALIETEKMPIPGGLLRTASFYFEKKNLNIVGRKYVQFFGFQLTYTSTSLDELKKFSRQNNIFPKEVVGGDYCYVSTTINTLSFEGWLMSDLHDSGATTIGEIVNVLEPTSVLGRMAYRYKELAKKYSPFLNVPNED